MTSPARIALCLILFWGHVLCKSAVQLSPLSEQDVKSLVRVFESSLSKPKDVPSLAYGIAGLKLLEQKVPKEEEYCAYVKTNVKADNIEAVYSALDIARRLKGCKLDNTVVLEDTLKSAITTGGQRSTQDLYYVISGLKFLNAKFDNAKFLEALKEALSKDDSISSLSYALHAASRASGDLKSFANRIEDVVAQADEVDGVYLQFEGGLSVTANAISGILALGEKNNKTAPMKSEEAVKMANYLLSRKSVQLPRPAYHLVRALQFLNKNKHLVPVAMTLDSNLAMGLKNPAIVVKVSDIFGAPLAGITGLVATAATHEKSLGVVLSRAAFTKTGEGLFGLNFVTDDRQEGFYTVQVEAQANDKRYAGLSGQVRVKVLADAAVQGVELSVADRDQTSGSKPHSIQYPNRLASVIEADYHQKLLMKFVLREKKSQQSITVQQAFVMFRNEKSKQEVIFVAEPDAEKVYKFDVDLQKSGNDFDRISGKYNMFLVVGDAVLSNSFEWHVADLSLRFAGEPKVIVSHAERYKPKKIIKHQFREPEKRPPLVISNAFTILSLAPLGLLLILWIALGANISNFLVSPFTLAFHVGLGGIFALYGLFWLQLNMFQTLRYLCAVGAFTFLAGNAMLRRMAERRLEKKKAQ